MIIVTMLYFIILNHRIIFEEKMLVEEFGEEYKKYKKKLKKLFHIFIELNKT
ncbi:hypothetical protein JW865_00240 [Candidatus Bathyarchaeota archaeon]|nr:hypothetical protein [Candidatus Bathyarchaeota archaeon]